jgi:hypothetical protein
MLKVVAFCVVQERVVLCPEVIVTEGGVIEQVGAGVAVKLATRLRLAVRIKP